MNERNLSKAFKLATTDPAKYAAYKAKEAIKGMDDREVVALAMREELGCEMSPRQTDIYNRVVRARALFLVDMMSWTEIRDTLMSEFGVQSATAARDIAQASKIFGELEAVSKEMHRLRVVEMCLKAYKRALETDDVAGMTRAAKTYGEMVGLNQTTDESINIEKLMADRVHAVLFEEETQQMLLMMMQQGGGVIDSSKMFETMMAAKGAQDVDFEEIKTPSAQ